MYKQKGEYKTIIHIVSTKLMKPIQKANVNPITERMTKAITRPIKVILPALGLREQRFFIKNSRETRMRAQATKGLKD
jgi:hypothetical protein